MDQIEKWLLVSGVTLFSIKEEWFLGAPRWKSKQLPANGGESYPIIEVEL